MKKGSKIPPKGKFCHEKPKWLTIELENKVRSIFEIKYQRTLSKTEVCEISLNLANFVDDILKHISGKDEIYSICPKIN